MTYTATGSASGVTGLILGLVGGVGVALVVSRLPAFRRPTLSDRLAPYLADRAQRSRLLDEHRSVTPFATLERLLRPTVRVGSRALERGLGGNTSVRRRLIQAGEDMSVEQFRAEQLVWGGLGLLSGVVFSLAILANAAVQPGPLAGLCVFAAFAGVLLRDRILTRAVRSRSERILAEFPTIAELFALSVTAGEGTVGALERVTRVGSGELVRELHIALSDVRAGATLSQALQGLAHRTAVPALARFVDGVLIAIERGTPLADVLRAQADDVREASKRALIEAGGRREIAMMVPVVFLILPLTVIYALFPGFYGLTFTTP